MKASSRYSLGIAVLGVLWLFAVIFGYYVVHKPFTGDSALAVANSLSDILVVSLVLFVASALGRRLMRGWTFASTLEALVFQAGLGLGILSLGTFVLGISGLLYRLLFWALVLLGLVLLRHDVSSIFGDLRSLHIPLVSRFERGLALFVGFSLALALVAAVTPPVAWDALQYHLIGPKLALAHGRITAPPDNLSLSDPSLVEMLFLAAMLLKGDIAAQLIHLSYLFMTVGAILAFAQRYSRTSTGWVAAALLVAVPSFLLVSTWAYNDAALAFYSFAALYCILRMTEDDDWRPNLLAGVFAGMAMGEKYTAGIVVLVLALLILRTKRKPVIKAIVFAGVAALVASPWYLRNWFFTGNPIYPFVFGGQFWDSFRSQWYSRFGTGLFNQPLRLLTAPWEATVLGREDGTSYQATIGPLLLALLPLHFATLRTRRDASKSLPIGPMWLFAGAIYLTWLVGLAESKLLSQTRLLFLVFPVLAVIAADAMERTAALELAQFSLQRFTRLVVALVLILSAISSILGLISDRPLDYLLGLETREQYLARHLGEYYSVAQFVNTELPTDGRILFLWEPRSYYIQHPSSADAILDTWAHLRYVYHDANAIAEELRREGYSYVLLNRAGLDYMLQTGYDPITNDDMQALQELIGHHLRPIYGDIPFEYVTRDGKPAVSGADTEAYAVYMLDAPGQ